MLEKFTLLILLLLYTFSCYFPRGAVGSLRFPFHTLLLLLLLLLRHLNIVFVFFCLNHQFPLSNVFISFLFLMGSNSSSSCFSIAEMEFFVFPFICYVNDFRHYSCFHFFLQALQYMIHSKCFSPAANSLSYSPYLLLQDLILIRYFCDLKYCYELVLCCKIV